jgi:hypothetical protein
VVERGERREETTNDNQQRVVISYQVRLWLHSLFETNFEEIANPNLALFVNKVLAVKETTMRVFGSVDWSALRYFHFVAIKLTERQSISLFVNSKKLKEPDIKQRQKERSKERVRETDRRVSNRGSGSVCP